MPRAGTATSDTATQPAHGVTFRAVAVGMLGTAVLAVVTPFSDMLIRGTWIACSHLPIGPFVLFLVLMGWGTIITRLFAARLALSRQEVMVAYVMMLVGAGIPSFGLTEYLIPTLAGPFYFQRPENNWVGLFFRHIPQWLVPVDLTAYPGVTRPDWVNTVYAHLPAWLQPAKPEAARLFYEGLPVNQQTSFWRVLTLIPWGAWVIPVVCWVIYAALIWALLFCVSVVLRKQWVERERLTFPLVQLPLEMVRGEPAPGTRTAFFRSPLMWIGFWVPMIIHGINGLHVYYPAVPEVPLVYNLQQLYFATPPWNQIGMFVMWFHFSVIGFSFLLPTDLSFSLWFFYLLHKVEQLIIASYGGTISYVPNYPVPTFAAMQMLGAFVVFVIYMFWLARPQLREIWRGAFREPVSAEAAGEPISYRTALLGLLICIIALAGLGAVAGLAFWLGVLTFLLFLVIAIVLTRFVSEGGLLFIQAPFRPTDMMQTMVTAQAIGAQNLTVLAFVERIFIFDLRAFLMPSLMDTWRIADTARIVKRRLLPALVLAIALATVLSLGTLLVLSYHYGAVTLEPWFTIWAPQQPFQVLASNLVTPRTFHWTDLQLVTVGGAVMLFLFRMRATFAGWPLHPIGYAMGPSWPMIQLWFSIMVGWLLKSLILRYGGMNLFSRSRVFFLGLVLGEFSAAGLWLIIDAITGLHGHRFFLT